MNEQELYEMELQRQADEDEYYQLIQEFPYLLEISS